MPVGSSRGVLSLLGLGTAPPSAVFAGGSVPASGLIVYSDGTALTGGSDTDIAGTFGRMKVGFISGNPDRLYLAHFDHFTAGSYALSQGSGGETYLNTASGTNLRLRVANSTVFDLTATIASFSSDITSVLLNAPAATLTLGDGTGAPFAAVNGAAGSVKSFVMRTAGSNRWLFRAGSAAESGANAGSPFEVTAADDAGTTIDTPISIIRAAGGTITLGSGSTTRQVSIPCATSSTSGGTGGLVVAGGIGAGGNSGFGSRVFNFSTATSFSTQSSAVTWQRCGGTVGTAGDMILQSDTAGPRDFLFVAGATPAIVAKIGASTPAADVPAFTGQGTSTIVGAVGDGYTGGDSHVPTYSAATALTISRHNYINLVSPALTGAGPAALTDACVFRFNSAAGTHKAVDSGTTKTSPGTVTAWVKVNIAGTVHYMPAYASKTT